MAQVSSKGQQLSEVKYSTCPKDYTTVVGQAWNGDTVSME